MQRIPSPDPPVPGETEKYQYTINIDVPVSAFHVVAMHRRTNRIEIVLSLHVVLDEHYIVHCLLQFERVLFPSLNVTHRFVQPRHHRRQSIVAAQSSETTAQGSHQATETESLRLIESQLVPLVWSRICVALPIRGRGCVQTIAAGATSLHVANGIGTRGT